MLTYLVVATDSEEIAAVIEKQGGTALLTDPALPTGSDRVAAVAEHYPDADVIINLQGDEPFIKPLMLEQLVAPYLSGEFPVMTTLAYPLDKAANYTNPGAVKVITDLNQDAIYFPAPLSLILEPNIPHRFITILVFTLFAEIFLLHYKNLMPTPLEKAESLEQLRVLEHGYKIRVCLTAEKTFEIIRRKNTHKHNILFIAMGRHKRRPLTSHISATTLLVLD